MTDEPENLTLKLLREMRAEMREGLTELRSEMREGFAELRGSVSELQHEVAAMRVDQVRMHELLEMVHATQQSHGPRLNAIDGRLALIEIRVGMVKA